MSDEQTIFKYGEEVFVAFNDEKDIYRDGWFIFCELGSTGLIVKTKQGGILLVPIVRLLKMRKKGGKLEEFGN